MATARCMRQELRRDYQNAINLVAQRSEWQPQVATCSAKEKTNIDGVWAIIQNFETQMHKNGAIAARRAEQNRAWMQRLFQQLIENKMQSHPEFLQYRAELENSVEQGKLTPILAAQKLMTLF